MEITSNFAKLRIESDEEFFDAKESFDDSVDKPDVNKRFASDFSPALKLYSSDTGFQYSDFSTDTFSSNPRQVVKNKSTRPWKIKELKKKNKDFSEFSQLSLIQEVPVPSMENYLIDFSPDGRFLSIAGEEPVIILFEFCRQKFKDEQYLLYDEEFSRFTGHSSVITSVSWSASSLFFISSSLDGMIFKYSIAQPTPIASYAHLSQIICVSLSPQTEDIFFTACSDSKIRIWNAPSANVECETIVNGEITAGNYGPNGIIVVGLMQGFCIVIFYNHFAKSLEILHKIDCRNKRGPKSTGRKITGIDFFNDDFLLVSSNDSRIRLFDFDTFEIKQKYKGLKNEQHKLFATVENASHVICGSETGAVYIWNLFSKYVPKLNPIFTKTKKYKNNSYEYFAIDSQKACCFARLVPEKIVNDVQRRYNAALQNFVVNSIIVVVKKGTLFVFYNKGIVEKQGKLMRKSIA